MWMFLVGGGVRFGNLLCSVFWAGFMVAIIRLRAVVLVVPVWVFLGMLVIAPAAVSCLGLFGCDDLVLLEVVWVCRA